MVVVLLLLLLVTLVVVAFAVVSSSALIWLLTYCSNRVVLYFLLGFRSCTSLVTRKGKQRAREKTKTKQWK